MQRCLQLARKGEGSTTPNPMVGAVIVHNAKIIGEGYHQQFGGAHAEVNAIESVADKRLLPEATMWVSLEPCLHHGKTAPCTDLIISNKIANVVVAVRDPNPKVSGRGIEMLRKKGVKVVEGIMEKEATKLNRVFFLNQLYSRPFVILKWAESSDGFIDHLRTVEDGRSACTLSNELTQVIVHKMRTTTQAIMVGTNTAILDNPKLTARKWYGKQPIRVVVDRRNRIPGDSAIFDGSVPTIIFTESTPKIANRINLEFIGIDFSEESIEQILNHLYNKNICSILVEGGAELLSSFIKNNIWDEAFVELSEKKLFSGVKAPIIGDYEVNLKKYANSIQYHLKSKITRNFL